jgi:hypothetical protein
MTLFLKKKYYYNIYKFDRYFICDATFVYSSLYSIQHPKNDDNHLNCQDMKITVPCSYTPVTIK